MRYVASREEMQQIDAYSINTMGIPGIVLMEKAALALEEVFLERVSTKSHVLIVTEKGNNGGDGLALGRLLLEDGYIFMKSERFHMIQILIRFRRKF